MGGRAFAGIAVAAALSAGAASAASYTGAVFFGDSLSDPGNLFAATGAPPEPYWEGRTSNGPVWAEHVADKFTAKGLPTRNYAYAYATAVETDQPPPGSFALDLPQQIASFAASGVDLGRRPVAAIWIGNNDVIGAISPGATPEQITGAALGAAGAVGASIGQLSGLGIHDFVVLNMPPLELTPQFQLPEFTPEGALAAQLGSGTFNAALAQIVASLDSSTTRIASIDIHQTVIDLIEDPEAFGVTDAVNPCFDRVSSLCTPEQSLERAFFDPLHPNLVLHEDIAEIAGAEMQPVPLPAPALLLFAAVAMLAAVGGRRGA